MAACASHTPTGAPVYKPSAFSQLPGWPADNLTDVLAAFRDTCTRFSAAKLNPVGDPALGTMADWAAACDALPDKSAGEDEAEAYIEAWFVPYAVTDSGSGPNGLFTGYYEPELQGSLTRHAQYQTPLYGRPSDLVTVDLSQFNDQMKGFRIAGRVEHHDNGLTLMPYPDRAAIDATTLIGTAPVLAWAADPVDAFFLEIQGSGRVILDSGQTLRLGYAAGNGRPYTAIGKTLITDGQLTPAETTMPAIREWLNSHPDQAQAIMESNANMVFFKVNTGDGPLGSANKKLAPGISLAVDRQSIPLGALVWLDTDPVGGDTSTGRWQHLMVAEDTGGAIKGVVRGDIFFGHGADATAQAGVMKSHGQMWILVPRPQK